MVMINNWSNGADRQLVKWWQVTDRVLGVGAMATVRLGLDLLSLEEQACVCVCVCARARATLAVCARVI